MAAVSGRMAHSLNRRPTPPPAIGTIPGTGRPAIAPDPATGPIDSTACERDRTELANFDDEQQYRLLLDRREPRQRVVLSRRRPQASSSLRHRSARCRHCRWMWMAPSCVSAPSRCARSPKRPTAWRLSPTTSSDGTATRGRRSQLVLPARLLLERQTGRQVSSDLRPRETPRCAGPCATRLPGVFGRANPRCRSGAGDQPGGRGRGGGDFAACRLHARGAAAAPGRGRAGSPATQPVAAVWLAGELGGAALLGDAWKGGALVDAQLLTPDGKSIATASATIAAGARTFRVALTPSQPLPEGDYVLRVGARLAPPSIPSRESLRLRSACCARRRRRDLGPPRPGNGKRGSADRRPAIPPKRTGPRRDSDAGIGARPRAITRSDRQAARPLR